MLVLVYPEVNMYLCSLINKTCFILTLPGYRRTASSDCIWDN